MNETMSVHFDRIEHCYANIDIADALKHWVETGGDAIDENDDPNTMAHAAAEYVSYHKAYMSRGVNVEVREFVVDIFQADKILTNKESETV